MNKLKYEIAHIGINGENTEDAICIANKFAKIFDMSLKENNRSVFIDDSIEVMKGPYLGRLGHIAMGVSDCKRAIKDLTSRGFDVDMSTASYNDDGSLKAVYMKEEIGGFAIHIIQE